MTSAISLAERETLSSLIDFARLRVLEIGVGDGRLTWPFAAPARRWVAVDPDADEVRAAAEALARAQPKLRKRVRLALADARRLPFADGAFDLAFFSYSLC